MQTLDNRKPHMVTYIALVLFASNVATLAQPPDNAALLYYQAFLLYEKPDDATDKILDEFRHGEMAANEAIAKYIEQNRRVIDCVVRAADIAKCDWGYDYSQGAELAMPNLAQVRQLALLLRTDARWLAGQGDYQTALDRCVTLRKMALHICDKMLISYLVGIALDTAANRTAENVLGLVPGDVDTLNRFKSELTQTEEQFPSLASCLAQEAQVCAATMNKDKMHAIPDMAGEVGEDPSTGPLIERLTQGDEAFFQRNRNHWFSSVAKVRNVLESKVPYPEMLAKLDDLGKQLGEEMKGDPDATLTALSLSLPAVRRIYQLTVRKQTHLNAITTAIGLYIAKAKTGQLPDALPADSAPDLFSGKPFAYAKTADGFILRCQGREDLDRDKVHEFKFKIGR